MRRHLAVLVAATTSAVVLAFLVPLLLLVRTLAEDRAVAAATQNAQAIAAFGLNATDQHSVATLRALVDSTPGTTAVLPDGTVLGPKVDDPKMARAAKGESFVDPRNGGAVVYVVSLGERGVAYARTVVPPKDYHANVMQATLTIVALGVLMMLAAVLAAYQLARRVSAPFMQLAAAADAMRMGRLETRVPERGMPEVVALARALNRLAARVAQLLGTERDAVADLAHRLRTPVTALRLDSDSVADPELADRLLTHVAHLERVVDAIVHDARRPVVASVGTSCDVSRVVGERVAFWSALADDQGRRLTVELPGRPAVAAIDTSDLSDVVDVLIDNVFAHTDDGTPLTVQVRQFSDGRVELSVEDGGPGFPSGDVVQRGHSGAGSTGLGLDIVRRAALATGGSMDLGRSRFGGAMVRLVLGAAPA